MDDALLYLIPIFIFVSLIYSMIGQGGASAYLAFLALFNITYTSIPSTALACNIAAMIPVVYHFHRAGHVRFKLVIPFIIASIPTSFIGGIIDIPENLFLILLSIVLFILAVKSLFFVHKHDGVKEVSTPKLYIIGLTIGAALGLLAGLIGIGGGIFLFPILLILKWATAKEAAIAGGLFTLANSVAGLIGHEIHGNLDWHLILPLMAAVITGSLIGSRLGAYKISAMTIQRIFAFVILAVAIRLIVGIS